MNKINQVITLSLFCVIFCTVFMIIGVVDSIKFVLNFLFNKSKNSIKNSNEAEFVIRNLVNKNLWNKNYGKLILVDSDDSETKKIISIAKNDFEFIDFLSNRQIGMGKNEKTENYSN